MVSEQKLNEILGGIINNYKMKGCISTNALCDIMEKYDTNPNQIDYVYKSLGEAGIQIVDEDERDKELFEQALSDIGLDDPVKMYLKDIGKVPLLSADEEIELAQHMQDGDEAAKNGFPKPTSDWWCRLQSAMSAGACSFSILFRKAIWD